MALSKKQQTERQEAIGRLREWIKPGDTVYTLMRHVSRSGMQRSIQVIVMHNGEPAYLGFNVAKAVGMPYDRKNEGVKVGGCGMDMGFHLVYELAHALWPGGVPCTGRNKCQSNDHRNHGPEREKYGKRVIHRDSGYAIRHRWL